MTDASPEAERANCGFPVPAAAVQQRKADGSLRLLRSGDRDPVDRGGQEFHAGPFRMKVDGLFFEGEQIAVHPAASAVRLELRAFAVKGDEFEFG